jgi:hypothetical protein
VGKAGVAQHPQQVLTCAALALELSKAYVDMFGEEAIDIPEGAVRQEEQAARHRTLIFELNRSGKYIEMRRRLKESVCAVAQEQFKRGLNTGESAELYNALYAHMVDEMHGVLNGLRCSEKPAEGAPRSQEELTRLEQLAAECEVTDDLERAEHLHQERCACGEASFCQHLVEP